MELEPPASDQKARFRPSGPRIRKSRSSANVCISEPKPTLILVILAQEVVPKLIVRVSVALSGIVNGPLSLRVVEKIGMRRPPVDHQGHHRALGSPNARRTQHSPSRTLRRS
jgi:hypothetical protein